VFFSPSVLSVHKCKLAVCSESLNVGGTAAVSSQTDRTVPMMGRSRNNMTLMKTHWLYNCFGNNIYRLVWLARVIRGTGTTLWQRNAYRGYIDGSLLLVYRLNDATSSFNQRSHRVYGWAVCHFTAQNRRDGISCKGWNAKRSFRVTGVLTEDRHVKFTYSISSYYSMTLFMHRMTLI